MQMRKTKKQLYVDDMLSDGRCAHTLVADCVSVVHAGQYVPKNLRIDTGGTAGTGISELGRTLTRNIGVRAFVFLLLSFEISKFCFFPVAEFRNRA